MRAYGINDPPVVRQEPISPRALRVMLKSAKTKRDTFIANMIIGAFFFACRSCEYVRTPGEPRTRTIAAADVKFFRIRDGEIEITGPDASRATGVQLHFRMQKNMSAEDRVSMHATGEELCPVRAWAHIISTLASAHHTLVGIAVNDFRGTGGAITYSDINRAIKATIRKSGTEGAEQTYGTHSVRCGAALAMYLNGTSIVDIMLQGRWSSDAFILYIKRELLQRSVGISSDMLKTEDFTLIPKRPQGAILHRSKTSMSSRSSREDAYVASPSLHLSH